MSIRQNSATNTALVIHSGDLWLPGHREPRSTRNFVRNFLRAADFPRDVTSGMALFGKFRQYTAAALWHPDFTMPYWREATRSVVRGICIKNQRKRKTPEALNFRGFSVEVAGFEPAAFWSRIIDFVHISGSGRLFPVFAAFFRFPGMFLKVQNGFFLHF